jgi:hypothetical protein
LNNIYICIIILSEKNRELRSLIGGDMNSFVKGELLDLSNGRGSWVLTLKEINVD